MTPEIAREAIDAWLREGGTTSELVSVVVEVIAAQTEAMGLVELLSGLGYVPRTVDQRHSVRRDVLRENGVTRACATLPHHPYLCPDAIPAEAWVALIRNPDTDLADHLSGTLRVSWVRGLRELAGESRRDEGNET